MLLLVVDAAARLEQITKLVEGAEKLAGVLGILLSTGVTGIVVAWHRLRSQIKDVESSVKPAAEQIKAEVVAPTPPEGQPDANKTTLREKVDGIANNMAADKPLRESQHQFNAQMLGDLRDEVALITEVFNELATDLRYVRGDMGVMTAQIIELQASAKDVQMYLRHRSITKRLGLAVEPDKSEAKA